MSALYPTTDAFSLLKERLPTGTTKSITREARLQAERLLSQLASYRFLLVPTLEAVFGSLQPSMASMVSRRHITGPCT